MPAYTIASQNDAGRAVVLIYGKSLDASAVGQGFVIGDGTLVVTAHHIVYGRRRAGDHQTDAMVEVVSPYLGDACEAQVVGEDRSLDVALLRIPWKGHPALMLKAQELTVDSRDVVAMAYADAARAVAEGRANDLQEGIGVQTKKLPVDQAFGGCPLVSPTGEAVGCSNGSNVVASAKIQQMVDAAGLRQCMMTPVASMAPDSRAGEATRMFLWSWALSAAGKHEMSYFAADTFALLRPNSPLGHKNVATAASQLGWYARAEEAYQRALKCDPNSASIRVLYGQFLAEHDQQTKALTVFRSVWEPAETNTIAIIPMCNLLAKEAYFAECVTLLEHAVQRRPNDGLLWVYLAQDLRATGKREAAAEAFSRAAALMPEKPALAIAVAEEFEAAGRMDKAEQQYRRLTYQDSAIVSGHFLLARFLAKDSTREAEALEECEAALAMRDDPQAPPREVVRKLASELQRRAAARRGRTFPTSQEFKL